MGLRGPKPKSAILRVIDGTLPPEAVPARAVFEHLAPPRDMPKSRKAIWWRCVNGRPPGFYVEQDTDTLAAFCAAAELHAKALRMIDRHGAVIEGGSGPVKSPWVAIKDNQAKLIATLGTRLGIGPGDRDGVTKAEARQSKFAGLTGRR